MIPPQLIFVPGVLLYLPRTPRFRHLTKNIVMNLAIHSMTYSRNRSFRICFDGKTMDLTTFHGQYLSRPCKVFTSTCGCRWWNICYPSPEGLIHHYCNRHHIIRSRDLRGHFSATRDRLGSFPTDVRSPPSLRRTAHVGNLFRG